MNTTLYRIGKNVYINLTNRCSNDCVFCLRNGKTEYKSYELWLEKEPETEEIIKNLPAFFDAEEFVFCGFGEPLFAFEKVTEIGAFLRSNGKKVRLNTNGQADLIAGSGAAARLKGAVDTVSISLNASDAEKYQALCRCAYGEEGYYSLLRFAKECKDEGIKVVLSVVDTAGGEEIKKAEDIALSLGVGFRVRHFEA